MYYSMRMRVKTVKESEYNELKKKAELNEDLLTQLVSGLEDIKAGRIKPWKRTTNRSSS